MKEGQDEHQTRDLQSDTSGRHENEAAADVKGRKYLMEGKEKYLL